MTTLEQYRDAKRDAVKLQQEAKKELIANFHTLSSQLLTIQAELRTEFGVKLAIPIKPPVGRGKKAERVGVANDGITQTQGWIGAIKEQSVTKEKAGVIKRVEIRLATQERKHVEALKTGKDVKAIEDRIYELEDELRLAKEG